MAVKFGQRHVDLVFVLKQTVIEMSDQSKPTLIAYFLV